MSIVSIIRSQNDLVHGKPATQKMIEEAEKTLSVYFAEDYTQYRDDYISAMTEYYKHIRPFCNEKERSHHSEYDLQGAP